MAKKLSPEFEAIRVAMKRPERSFFISRRMCWGRGKRPCEWGFFTNWRGFSINLGAVESVSDGDTASKSVLLISLDWYPFGFVIWWRSKRLIWIGDWEWKKALSSD